MARLCGMLATVAKSEAPKAGPVQINLKMPPELLEAVDAWVEDLNRKRSWPKMTRSDVIRAVLERACRERPDLEGK